MTSAAAFCGALLTSAAAWAQGAKPAASTAGGASDTAAQAAGAAVETADKAAGSIVEYAKLAVPYLLTAIGALVLFIIGRMVSAWVGRLVSRGLAARKFDKALTKFLSNLSRTLVMLGVVLGILGMFGIETTSFAAVIGAAGLAIGLAFQGTLSNFAAGVLILTFKPFELDDMVKAGGEMGFVKEIGLFTITLLTLDNQRIIVPNSAVTSANIINLTGEPLRRVDVNVGTDYAADLDETRAVLEKAAAAIKGSLKDPAPEVFLAELGGSSVNWQMRIWCNTEDYWDVWQRTTRDTKVALDEAGISIPFPQMDVHLDKLEG